MSRYYRDETFDETIEEKEAKELAKQKCLTGITDIKINTAKVDICTGIEIGEDIKDQITILKESTGYFDKPPLRNIIIQVSNQEERIAIQQLLFDNGFSWIRNDKEIQFDYIFNFIVMSDEYGSSSIKHAQSKNELAFLKTFLPIHQAKEILKAYNIACNKSDDILDKYSLCSRECYDLLNGNNPDNIIKVNIKQWDMQRFESYFLPHQLNWLEIKSIHIIILDDLGNKYDCDFYKDHITWSKFTEHIEITRKICGCFDSVNFSDTTVNRGIMELTLDTKPNKSPEYKPGDKVLLKTFDEIGEDDYLGIYLGGDIKRCLGNIATIRHISLSTNSAYKNNYRVVFREYSFILPIEIIKQKVE